MHELLTNARALAHQLTTDVAQASNRVEHIRLVTRANEAAHLVLQIEKLLTNDKS